MSRTCRYLGVIALCAVALSACGGGKPASTALRVGWSAEPDTMNPITSYSSQAMEIYQLVYDKLIGYDLDLKARPELAREFSYSDGGKVLTFRLRDNAKWHDGEKVTADDVVFTFSAVKEKELGEYAQWLTHMTSIKALDAATVELRFDLPQAFNPALAIPILPKHIWGSMSADEIQKFHNDKAVGSGPFRLVEWKNGTSITLERNPDFWGDAPKMKTITYVLFSNEDIMAQALRSGDIDVVTEMPPTIWDGMKTAKNVRVVSLPSYSFHHVGFNVSADPASKGNALLRDKTIRQALAWALDRRQLVELALAGHGQPGDTIVPVGLRDWHLSIPAAQRMEANPQKARDLLEKAGYIDRNGDGVRESPTGAPLKFRMIATQTVTVDVRAAQLFKDAAEKIGVRVDVQALDENTLGNTVYNKAPDWDLFVWGWDSNVPDPTYMLSVPLTGQIGANNDVFYSNKSYDDLFSRQSTAMDVKARKAIVDEMQKMFYDDAAYIVMWYQDKLQGYRTDTWKGWKEIPGGLIYNFTRGNYLSIVPAR
jgi:peptide/nickel transport system substrate-binding protein